MDKKVQMYILIGDSHLSSYSLETNTMERQDAILIIGENKERQKKVLIIPYEKRRGKFEFKEEIWGNEKNFMRNFAPFAALFKGYENNFSINSETANLKIPLKVRLNNSLLMFCEMIINVYVYQLKQKEKETEAIFLSLKTLIDGLGLYLYREYDEEILIPFLLLTFENIENANLSPPIDILVKDLKMECEKILYMLGDLPKNELNEELLNSNEFKEVFTEEDRLKGCF
jgi:hypothetical protein